MTFDANGGSMLPSFKCIGIGNAFFAQHFVVVHCFFFFSRVLTSI